MASPHSNNWHLELVGHPDQEWENPPYVGQIRLKPNEMPTLPGVRRNSMPVVFDVFYLLAPQRLCRFLFELHFVATVPNTDYAENHPGLIADVSEIEALGQKLNCDLNGTLVHRSGEVNVTLPPQGIIDIINDPSNGDGTSTKLGEWREEIIVSLGSYGMPFLGFAMCCDTDSDWLGNHLGGPRAFQDADQL